MGERVGGGEWWEGVEWEERRSDWRGLEMQVGFWRWRRRRKSRRCDGKLIIAELISLPASIIRFVLPFHLNSNLLSAFKYFDTRVLEFQKI